MWVVEEGENLVEGDYLISSATPGHAMKDNGQFDLANIISRVAEPVDWSTVTEVINGKKHKRISVLFESFVRNHKADKLENEMKLIATVNANENESENRDVDGGIKTRGDVLTTKCRIGLKLSFSSMKYFGFISQAAASSSDADSTVELIGITSDKNGKYIL